MQIASAASPPADLMLNGIPEFYREDGATQGKGEMPEKGKVGEGGADRKTNESVREQTGNGTEAPRPSSESGSGETHGNMPESIIPESPETPDNGGISVPELPESPEVPELPQNPES